MKQEVINLFGLNRDRILQERKYSKTLFYELDKFNTAKKKIFQDEIKEINLLALLNEDTINISAYTSEEINYSELYFFYVELKEIKHLSQITETIHTVIHNPIVLIYAFEGSILVSTSLKRLNKQEANKQVIEEEFISPWINLSTDNQAEKNFLSACNIRTFSFTNLYLFHQGIIRLIYQSRLIDILGEFSFQASLANDDIQEFIRPYDDLSTKIVSLNYKLTKLTEFGDKVSVKQEIIETQAKLDKIKLELKQFIKDKELCQN